MKLDLSFLPPRLSRAIVRQANRDGKTVSQWVTEALEAALMDRMASLFGIRPGRLSGDS